MPPRNGHSRRATRSRRSSSWIDTELTRPTAARPSTRARDDPPAQPGRVQQHDSRPGRHRLPSGRRLPVRRRRLRLRQHRRRAVHAADPAGEVPGRRRDRSPSRRSWPANPPRRRSRTWDARRLARARGGPARATDRDPHLDGRDRCRTAFPRDGATSHPSAGCGEQAGPSRRMAVRIDGKDAQDVRRDRDREAARTSSSGEAPRRASGVIASRSSTTIINPTSPTRRRETGTWSSTTIEVEGRCTVPVIRCPSATGDHLSPTRSRKRCRRCARRSSSGSPRGPIAGRSPRARSTGW